MLVLLDLRILLLLEVVVTGGGASGDLRGSGVSRLGARIDRIGDAGAGATDVDIDADADADTTGLGTMVEAEAPGSTKGDSGPSSLEARRLCCC